MERRIAKRIVFGIVAVILLGLVIHSIMKKDIGACTEYHCDVKSLNWSTTINIEKEGEHFATVKGNLFRFVTDPLTLYDAANTKIAYAGDEYHWIAQDSHSIFLNNTLAVEMVGRFNPFGETYDIYNSNNEKIGRVQFNFFNTKGKMYDTESKLVADYNSFFFFNDFDVRICEDCKIDENVMLMIFSSYYSDQAEDAKTSSSSNSSESK